jgi:autotransporter family porin
MNKIFKLIWSNALNGWVVCSELGKKTKSNSAKTLLVGAIALTSSYSTFAVVCDDSSGVWTPRSNCEILSTEKTISVGFESVLQLGNSANTEVAVKNPNGSLGDLTINATTSSQKNTRYDSSGIALANNGKLDADNLTVNIKATEEKKNISVFGLTAWGGSTVTANKITINAVHANEMVNLSDIDESYGIQVGTAVFGNDREFQKTSKVTVNDADIKLTNTPNSINNVPYQLSGIRVIRNEYNFGSNAIFESTGTVKIHVYDSSGGSANYITGIYVSGVDNKVILNNSAITIGESGRHSSALKIGKGRGSGTGGGIVESHGHMLLDTTAESTAPTVRLIGTGSKLLADDRNSSSEIKSANTAVLFGNNDYEFLFTSTSQEASFNNAKMNTTSTNASLILVNAGVTGAKMTVKGNESLLKAADGGWLVEVEDPSEYSNNNAEFKFTLDEGAKAQGLMNVLGLSTLNVDVNNGAVWELKSKTGLTEQRSTLTSLNLTNGAVLDAATNLTSSDSAQYFVKVPELKNDSGIISLINGKYQDVLTIESNYQGSGTAQVKMNTLWNAPGTEDGTNSTSDILRIKGTAEGTTRVVPVNVNGVLNTIDGDVVQIDKIINTVPVIYVETSGADAFTGSARTTGIQQVQLLKRTNGKSDEYYWSATALENDIDIYNPETPNYTQMPVANMELGYTTLATLHERRGENQTLAWDDCGTCVSDNKGQSWGRIVGSHLDLEGKNRFNLNGEQYVLQLGHDFIIQENAEKQTRNHTGGYISYGRSDIDFEDRYRTVDGKLSDNKHTGSGKTDAFSLGLYNTYYDKNGSYLDVIGQVSHLRNTYNSAGLKQVKQNGFGALISAEVGRPYALTEHKENESGWLLEPQAQLTYQYLDLKSFNDDVRTVNQNDQHGLRGRVGVRVAHNREAKGLKTDTVYFTANVLHDFLNQNDIDIGPDRIKEKYNNTWGSLGVGMQLPVSQHGYFYADGRYEHSFSSEKRETYRGTVGLKFTWK